MGSLPAIRKIPTTNEQTESLAKISHAAIRAIDMCPPPPHSKCFAAIAGINTRIRRVLMSGKRGVKKDQTLRRVVMYLRTYTGTLTFNTHYACRQLHKQVF